MAVCASALRGDEEVAATRLVQRGNDALGAEAVGIGFDDGGAPGGCDAFGERAPVGTDLREVDLDDAGGARRNLRGLHVLDDRAAALRVAASRSSGAQSGQTPI